MTPLTKSFTLEELVFSQTAAREGIDNTPAAAHVRAMRALCTNVLQPLRDAVGAPLVVSSGYRSPRLNKFVGGSARSQHMEGKAADVKADASRSGSTSRSIRSATAARS